MTPMPQRMDQRLADWGGLWKIRQENTPSPRPSLQQAAQQQASTLEPLTQGLLQRVLKALPDRASGPDAVSTQMLKSLPPLALTPLLQLFQTMEHTAELTPQQVLQGLPPPEEPDYEPPMHPSPMKRARFEQDHNVLHFGNVTNFGRQVIEWYWARDSGIYIFAETHLDPQKHFETCQYFTVRGRTAFGTPAGPNQDHTGAHGGLLVLADPASGVTQFEAPPSMDVGFRASSGRLQKQRSWSSVCTFEQGKLYRVRRMLPSWPSFWLCSHIQHIPMFA